MPIILNRAAKSNVHSGDDDGDENRSLFIPQTPSTAKFSAIAICIYASSMRYTSFPSFMLSDIISRMPVISHSKTRLINRGQFFFK